MFRLLSLYNPTEWDIYFHTDNQRTFFLNNINIPINGWEVVSYNSNSDTLYYLLNRNENVVMIAKYKYQQQTFDILITDCSLIDEINRKSKEMMEDINKALAFRSLPVNCNHCYADYKDIKETDWKVSFSKSHTWLKIP